jgi:hypothetical protein
MLNIGPYRISPKKVNSQKTCHPSAIWSINSYATVGFLKSLVGYCQATYQHELAGSSHLSGQALK